MWLLPALLLITAIVLSIPLSAYFAWLMDGKYHAPRFLRWFEELVDTGPQDWKQYVLAMLVFTRRAVRVRIRRSLPAADRAAQSARPRLARADDDLQHGHLLHDQHQPAALFGRPEFLQLQPDRSSSCRTCFFRLRSDSARSPPSFAPSAARRRSAISSSICGASSSTSMCRSRSFSASSSCSRACR